MVCVCLCTCLHVHMYVWRICTQAHVCKLHVTVCSLGAGAVEVAEVGALQAGLQAGLPRGRRRRLQANQCPRQGLAAVDCGGQGGTAGRKSGSDPGQGALLPPPALTHSPTPAREEGRAAKQL